MVMRIAIAMLVTTLCTQSIAARPPDLAVVRIIDGTTAELSKGKTRAILRLRERFGNWTLMSIDAAERRVALEDFTQKTGHVLALDENGVVFDLPKSLESTEADPAKLYLGHTREEIVASGADLLADEILAVPSDPTYERIAGIFPPLTNVRLGTYSFIGTPNSFDKIWFQYGGRSPNFDPVVLQPTIDGVRHARKVWDGLVGGYLPVLRFVYPETDATWTELIAFAPFRTTNGNDRVQPAWYRVSRVEGNTLKWSRYVDSYLPFIDRDTTDAGSFYSDLLRLKQQWDEILRPAMTVELPDERVQNMARFALVRAIMTRVGDFPKYGAVDKDYAGSEHDGFPDTFTVETAAMIEWGLLDRASRYIDNYFQYFVRDDGSLLYRGPETGQYGRMLTVLAQFVDAGGDGQVLLRHRARIDAIAKLLLALRERALELPPNDAAHGMLAGWSEADAVLEREPSRYMQPYFSNSTEAARGFRDLGRIWERIGTTTSDAALTAWGQRLARESNALRKDIAQSIAKSMLTIDGKSVIPPIAGVTEPFHLAVQRDRVDPQYRAYRAYMEMMHSGFLSPEQVRSIVDYRATHHDMLLGVPTAYGFNTRELVGFLSYGHGYGLVQSDMIRESLLLLYSHMAHQHTRGTWLAPETRKPLSTDESAPYCTPSQLFVPLMTRWLLVFEDPLAETLWLGKGIPRDWLEDGKHVSVSKAPTRWGSIGFSIQSQLRRKRIEVRLDLPQQPVQATTKLRLRAPGGARIQSVTINGKPWRTFDAQTEVIDVPPELPRVLNIVVRY